MTWPADEKIGASSFPDKSDIYSTRDGKIGWPEREIQTKKMESYAGDSRHLLLAIQALSLLKWIKIIKYKLLDKYIIEQQGVVVTKI